MALTVNPLSETTKNTPYGFQDFIATNLWL